MAPQWLPQRAVMQRYCEPYFTAIEHWRNYSDPSLCMNRVHLMQTADDILREYSQMEDTFEFDVITDCTNEGRDLELLPEVIPTPGKEYVESGDKKACNAAQNIVPTRIFNRIGVFFQSTLLKSMAGYNEKYLLKCNHETRTSVILAIEKLFRLPEGAGKGQFVYRHKGEPEWSPVPVEPMSESTKGIADVLIASKNASPTVLRSQPRVRNNPSRNLETSTTEEIPWTVDHSSVGTNVAAYFQQGKGKKLFFGRVEKYCGPSKPAAKDQLYHILWEDGDEEDYDETELKKGIALFEKERGKFSTRASLPKKSSESTEENPKVQATAEWKKDGEFIGKKVARTFKVGRGNKVSKGEVTEICEVSAVDGEKVNKYKVKFEDGKVLEYDDRQLSEGNKLYLTNFQVKKEDVEQENENVEKIEWVKDHPLVGTSVAGCFRGLNNRKRRLYRGLVENFAPESAPGERDVLFYIKWENGDEANYDEKELEEGIRLFQQHFCEYNQEGENENAVKSNTSLSNSAKMTEEVASGVGSMSVENAENAITQTNSVASIDVNSNEDNLKDSEGLEV